MDEFHGTATANSEGLKNRLSISSPTSIGCPSGTGLSHNGSSSVPPTSLRGVEWGRGDASPRDAQLVRS